MAEVALRPIDDADLDALFEQMRDPSRSGWPPSRPKILMTAPRSMSTWRRSGRCRGDHPCGHRRWTVRRQHRQLRRDGDTEVAYWIDRSFWAGIVGRALGLLLESVHVRPLFARAASDNVGSLKVLQRAGFAIVGTAISFANARNKEIEETILRLDEPAKSAPPDASGGDRQTY